MAARQYLKIWKESSDGQVNYGSDPFSPPGSPVLNTDYVVVRLVDNNAFSMRQVPVQKPIRSVDGYNRRVQMVASQFSVSGQLQTLLYPSQAAFWATALTPHSTSKNLPSYVIDHAIVLGDNSNTVAYRRYLGVKIAQAVFSGSAQTNLFHVNFTLTGKQAQSSNITITDFPEPSFATYPSELPFLFTQLSTPGYLKTNNSARTEFNSFELTIQNMLDAPFNESPYVTRVKYCGRNVDWVDKFVYVSTADRTAFEAATAQTQCSASLNNGAKNMVFDLQGAVYITGVDDDLSLDKTHEQTIHYGSFVDGSTGNDLTITVS